MAVRQYSVVRAFNSYAGDGSGEERYFTTGNQHELEGFVSAEELQYRVDEGYVTVAEEVEVPERVFVRPEAVEVDTPAPRPRTRQKRGATTHTEE